MKHNILIVIVALFSVIALIDFYAAAFIWEHPAMRIMYVLLGLVWIGLAAFYYKLFWK